MKTVARLDVERRQVMDGVLNILWTRGHFMPYGKSLPLIGALLYLIKRGLDLKVLSSACCLDEYNILDACDPLYKLVQEALRTFLPDGLIPEWLRDVFAMLVLEDIQENGYIAYYDYAIENVCHRDKHSGLYMIPRGMCLLANAFIGNDAGSVYIPFGGTMNFVTELEDYDRVEATECDLGTWQVGMLRAALSTSLDNITFTCEHPFYWHDNAYDAIISMPPLGARMQIDNTPSPFYQGRGEDSDLIAPSRFLASSSADGTCIAFAPVSILWGEGPKKAFRTWAMEHHILDTVILLPHNILANTSVQTACVILRRKPFHENAVRMIDASGMYDNVDNKNLLDVGKVMAAYHTDIEGNSKTVFYSDIVEMDYSWNIPEYLHADEVECPDGYQKAALNEIVHLPRLASSTAMDGGKVVKVSDLSDDWTNPFVDMDALTYTRDLRNCRRLCQKAILISSVRTLKPSIIFASEEAPVWINPNVIAIVPKDGLDMEFLCMELSKLHITPIGIAIPHISKSAILRKKIAYPDMPTQKQLFKEACHASMLSKAKAMGLQKLIDEMKAEYINEVRIRKHDMKTPMTQLGNTLPLLDSLVRRLPEPQASELAKYTQRLRKSHEVLSAIVSHIADEDVFATPELLDIETILKSYESATDRYYVEYRRDSASLETAGIDTPFVMMGKSDFERLTQNIVSNAIVHGFVKDNAEYSLNITLSAEDGFFVIVFSNNGEPLPEEIDKNLYGAKAVKGRNSAGTGIGGYVVKSITQHYGGDYDIKSTKFADMFFTNVIVKLPIYRKEDE